MRFPVEYRGQEAGFVEATQDIHGIQFEATCTLHTQDRKSTRLNSITS